MWGVQSRGRFGMEVRFQAEEMKMMKTVREIFVMTAATLIIAAAVFF